LKISLVLSISTLFSVGEIWHRLNLYRYLSIKKAATSPGALVHATSWPGRHCSTVAFFSSKSFDLACYCSRYRSSTISHFQESERRRLAVNSKKLSAEHRDSPLVVRLIFLGFLSSHLVVCLFYSPRSIPLAFRLTKDRPCRRVLNKDGKEIASMETARFCAWLTHNQPEHPPTKKISPILHVISNHAPIRNLSPIVFAQLPFGQALQHRQTLSCDPRLPSHYPLLLSKALE